MHIAICDDNVADRKQLERLLGRESDARKDKTGVFFTDSFGQAESLYSKRMIYDLFFIDGLSGETDGISLSLSLIEGGVTSPIVISSASEELRLAFEKLEERPENLLFLSKPVLKAELSDVLDKAVLIEAAKEPTIELRSEKETHYVLEDDIVCCEQVSQYIDVTLKDGTIVSILDNLQNFYDHIGAYSHFAQVSNRAIINATYVEKVTAFSVTLNNKKAIKINLLGKQNLKRVLSLISSS